MISKYPTSMQPQSIIAKANIVDYVVFEYHCPSSPLINMSVALYLAMHTEHYV